MPERLNAGPAYERLYGKPAFKELVGTPSVTPRRVMAAVDLVIVIETMGYRDDAPVCAPLRTITRMG